MINLDINMIHCVSHHDSVKVGLTKIKLKLYTEKRYQTMYQKNVVNLIYFLLKIVSKKCIKGCTWIVSKK